MVDFITPWEVVKGMEAARRRGHGWVTGYLADVGVPRATAYRWEAELRWLAGFGMEEVRRLRRECERLSAAVSAGSGAAVREAVRGPQDEWGLVVEAAVLGNSDEDIVRLLVRAGGRAVSHQTIHAILAEAGARARKVFEQSFAGKGAVGAADEIFLGRAPSALRHCPALCP